MSAIVSCECGAKVRLPERMRNRSFRCPKCKTAIALSVEGGVLPARPRRDGEAHALCPICQTGIDEGEVFVVCPQCDQAHHRECWAEVGGCGTYGCTQAPAFEKNEPTQAPESAWGDEKVCPACKETIKAIALKCRYCGTEFDTVDPLTMHDLRRRVHRNEASRSLNKVVVVIFALSIIGVLAPLMAFVGAAVLIPKRREIARSGPIYQILSYSALGLSVVYSLLFFAFAVL
jgi:hypothetical protein